MANGRGAMNKMQRLKTLPRRSGLRRGPVRPNYSITQSEVFMFLVFLTFLVTTALYGVLLWLAIRRVSRHLQGNAEAIKAVTDHVLIPLLGRRPEGDREQWPSRNSKVP
jgi:hypothetical protein